MNNEKHETFCNYNLTNLLIKSGFDWQDYFVAHSIDEHFHWEIPLHIAQKWLREVKDVEVEIHWVVGDILKFGDRKYAYHIESDDFKDGNCDYTFYEEALEAGIKKALEIILEKGE